MMLKSLYVAIARILACQRVGTRLGYEDCAWRESAVHNLCEKAIEEIDTMCITRFRVLAALALATLSLSACGG
ncbi:MAG: hypothetical protein KGM44_08505, partial [bacterium]|nr:hypothetical protein [bacterium]